MNYFRNSLMARLTLGFLLLSLTGVGLTGYLVYARATEALKLSVFERLESIVSFKSATFNRWIEDRRADITFLAWLPEIRTQAGLLQGQKPSDPARAEADRVLSEYLNFVASRTYNIEELFILDSKGTVLYSTQRDHIGGSRADMPFFKKGRRMTFVQNAYISPVSEKLTITISTPLFNASGRRIGVLASHLNLVHIDRLFSQRSGLGRTGETWLADRSGQFITAPRYSSQKSETAALPDAFSGENQTESIKKAVSGLYRNYAGHPVVGVRRWLPEHDVVLAAEMGQKEAFAPARHLAWTILLIGAVVSGALTLGVYFLARQISRPVLDIADAAMKVADGDIHHQVNVVTRDEIGILATAFNRMTAWLRDSIEELEDRVAERTRSLEAEIEAKQLVEADLKQAKIAAEAANKAKSDFLATMSHEIRTPMNGVIGLSELALRQPMSPKLREYFRKINASGAILLGIINDILDFSKIEAGKIELESIDFDLDDLIENIIFSLGVKAEEKGLELLLDIEPEAPRCLKGDSLRLGQILINLINNAIKFTETGQVVIRLSHKPDKESENRIFLYCRVIDTGIGMNREQQSRLFDPFSQADGSITRRFGGTGLGLAITRRLVELMGGQMDVNSEPGSGSEFSFAVPFAIAETERPRLTLPDELRHMRVLVVDDNPTAREILCGILDSFSFQTVPAESGEKALRILESAPPEEVFDLILMDWKMPGMDGIDAAARVKSNPRLSRIPGILMVTAYGMEENRDQARQAGLDGFLTKPVNPSLLFDTILRIFGRETESEFVSDSVSGARTIPGLDEIRGARILLVEDNEINRDVAVELLSAEQFHVDTAANGQEAVDRLLAVYENWEGLADAAFDYQNILLPCDAVLMDLQMPVMDGYTATAEMERILREKYGPDVPVPPVIAMTAHALAGDREKCLAAGMKDYVSKPVNPRELFNALVRLIKPDRRDLPDLPGEELDYSLPPEMPGLDVYEGLERVGGSREAYHKLLIKFYRNHRSAVEDIRIALEKCEPETASRLAHTVKGVSGNIGAGALYHSLEAVEDALRKSDLSRVRPLLEDAVRHLDAVMEGIRPLAEARDVAATAAANNNASTPEDRVFDSDEVRRRLKELGNLVEMDIAGARKELEELGHILGAKPEIQNIAEALDNYDSDEALQEITGLAKRLGLSEG